MAKLVSLLLDIVWWAGDLDGSVERAMNRQAEEMGLPTTWRIDLAVR